MLFGGFFDVSEGSIHIQKAMFLSTNVHYM